MGLLMHERRPKKESKKPLLDLSDEDSSSILGSLHEAGLVDSSATLTVAEMMQGINKSPAKIPLEPEEEPIVEASEQSEMDITKIKKLDLSNCSLSPEYIEDLVAALPHMTSLVSLNFNNCKLRNRDIHAILSAIRKNPTKIEKLDLSNNYLGTANAIKLGRLLGSMTSLVSLKVHDCQLTDINALEILNAIKEHPTIKRCNFAGNKLGEQFISQITSLPKDFTVVSSERSEKISKQTHRKESIAAVRVDAATQTTPVPQEVSLRDRELLDKLHIKDAISDQERKNRQMILANENLRNYYSHIELLIRSLVIASYSIQSGLQPNSVPSATKSVDTVVQAICNACPPFGPMVYPFIKNCLNIIDERGVHQYTTKILNFARVCQLIEADADWIDKFAYRLTLRNQERLIALSTKPIETSWAIRLQYTNLRRELIEGRLVPAQEAAELAFKVLMKSIDSNRFSVEDLSQGIDGIIEQLFEAPPIPPRPRGRFFKSPSSDGDRLSDDEQARPDTP